MAASHRQAGQAPQGGSCLLSVHSATACPSHQSGGLVPQLACVADHITDTDGAKHDTQEGIPGPCTKPVHGHVATVTKYIIIL